MTMVESSHAEIVHTPEEEIYRSVDTVDIKISHTGRPKICTEFQESDMQNRMIILSDGSNWSISKKNPAITLAKVKECWKQGDDIRLARDYKGVHTGFIMYNVREEHALLVQSSEKCSNLSKAFFIAEVDPSGYALKTTDGKTWVTGFFGSFVVSRWKEDQRVIVNQGIYNKNDYIMIRPGTQMDAHVTEVFRQEGSSEPKRLS